MMNRIAPFIHTEKTTAYLEVYAIIALVPCIVFAVLSYGIRAISLIVFSVIVSILIDVCVGLLNKKQRFSFSGDKYYFDFSSIYEGILFSLMLPPSTSLVVAFVGLLFGNVVGKCIFGGRGSNFLSASLVGRLFIELAFTSRLSFLGEPGKNWLSFDSLLNFNYQGNASLKFENSLYDYSFVEMLTGRFPSFIGVGSTIMVVLGLIFMIKSNNYRFFASISYFITAFLFNIAVTTSVIGAFDIKYSFYSLLASGVVFSAVYYFSSSTLIAHKNYSAVIVGLISGLTYGIVLMVSDGISLIIIPCLVAELLSFCMDNVNFKNLSNRREANDGE